MTHEEAVEIIRTAMQAVVAAGFDVWGWDDGSVIVGGPLRDGNANEIAIPPMTRGGDA